MQTSYSNDLYTSLYVLKLMSVSYSFCFVVSTNGSSLNGEKIEKEKVTIIV